MFPVRNVSSSRITIPRYVNAINCQVLNRRVPTVSVRVFCILHPGIQHFQSRNTFRLQANPRNTSEDIEPKEVNEECTNDTTRSAPSSIASFERLFIITASKIVGTGVHNHSASRRPNI